MLFKKTFSKIKDNKINHEENESLNSKNSIISLNSLYIYNSHEAAERYKIMYNSLIAIGFLPRQINNCYRIFDCQSITDFIEKLIKTDGKYNHDFIKNEKTQLCEVCEEGENSHSIINKSAPVKLALLDKQFSSDEFSKKKTQTIQFLKKQSSEEANNKSKKTILSVKLDKEEAKKEEQVVEEENKNQNDDYRGHDDSIYTVNESLSQTSICEICESEIFLTALPPLYKLECMHIFCCECLDMYLQTKIKEGEVKSLTCPHKGCNRQFNQSDITDMLLLSAKDDEDQIMRKNLVDKYLKFLKNQEVERDNKKFFCPWANCEGYGEIEGLGINDNIDQIIQTVVKCNLNQEHEFCVLCGNKKHFGGCLSDQEIEILKRVKNKELMLKKCPNCKNWTEKHGGCNHMTCIHCKYEWCWICNQTSPPGHFNIPGTRCYQRQFPIDGRDDYEEFNEQDYNRAVEAILNPGRVVDNNVNHVYQNNNGVVALQAPRTIWYRTDNYENYKKDYILRISYSSKEPLRLINDGCYFCLHDCLFSLVTIILSFFGNPVLLFAYYRNIITLQDDMGLDTSDSKLLKFSFFLYRTSMFILYLALFLNGFIFSAFACVFHSTLSMINNCRRPNQSLDD